MSMPPNTRLQSNGRPNKDWIDCPRCGGWYRQEKDSAGHKAPDGSWCSLPALKEHKTYTEKPFIEDGRVYATGELFPE